MTALFSMMLAAVFLLCGCATQKIDPAVLMDDVTFEVVSVDPGMNGETNLTIQMTNNSDHTIVQNTVLYSIARISFDTNEPVYSFSTLAKNNQLNIPSGESIDLTIIYPKNVFQKELVNDHSTFISETVQFIGYFDKLDNSTYVDFIQSLQLEE